MKMTAPIRANVAPLLSRLDVAQREAAMHGTGPAVWLAGPGAGKCLGRGTPVLMFDGSVKKVEDVICGDLLMGPDSKPRTVLATGTGKESMYSVVPIKGEPWTCNASHVLSLKFSAKFRYLRCGLMTAAYYFSKSKRFLSKAKLWRTGVDFKRREVPVDPYFIGLWLGDGTSALNGVSITNVDGDIVKYLHQIADAWRLDINDTSAANRTPTYHFSAGRSFVGQKKAGRNPLLTAMLALGLRSNKRIPEIYKVNDRDTRLALLAGLIDSDGHHDKHKCYQFCSKWRALAEDVAFLCRSLGFAAYISDRPVTFRGKKCPRFSVSISGDLSCVPVLLKRKMVRTRKQIKDVLVTGFHLEYAGKGQYFGFELDGDGLFLLGDFTVTHNTSTLTARVARLISEGTPLDRILCTTFSVAGAEEMRKRIAEILGVAPDTLRHVVSTFHSQALRLLLEERDRLPWKMNKSPIIETPRIKRILRQIVPKERVGSARYYITRMRRLLIDPDEAMSNAGVGEDGFFASAYRQYHETLCTEGVVDFDSMVYWAVKLLEENQFAFRNWEGRFKYVIVDEAHDTSADQIRLAELLASPSNNLVLVGDRSQSIYSFRGAMPQVLDGDGKKVYYLGVNYRSAQSIIDTFRPLCEQDDESQRLAARMQSAKPNLQGDVQYLAYMDESEQASAVTENIAEALFSRRHLPEGIAVLSRTRALLAHIADELEYRGLPYKWSGKNFWVAGEVQDILGFAKLAVNPRDGEALHRAICSSAECVKYLGQKFADAVLKSASITGAAPLSVAYPDGITDWRAQRWDRARHVIASLAGKAATMPPKAFLTYMLNAVGLEKNGGGEEPDDFRAENVLAVLGRAARFSNLPDFLSHASVMAKRTNTKTGVTLSTIHGSKGLEWDSVWVIGVSEGVIPHAKAEDVEEERRILYVALSRARRELFVTYHRKPSMFLKMIQPVSESETLRATA
jgi:superfamily I DNA/RNA helicase